MWQEIDNNKYTFKLKQNKNYVLYVTYTTTNVFRNKPIDLLLCKPIFICEEHRKINYVLNYIKDFEIKEILDKTDIDVKARPVDIIKINNLWLEKRKDFKL